MYPHKEICKTLRKLISWAGGMDVIIQGTSSDSKGYNDGQSVAAKWIAAGITIQELYYLRRWFTFYLEPVRVPEFKRTVDVSPGYDDYAGKLEEMIRSGTASSVPGVFLFPFKNFLSPLQFDLSSFTIKSCPRN